MMMTMQWFMRRTFCCYATYMLHHKWYTITWWNNWCRHGASTWEEDGTHKSWRRSQKNGVGQLRLLFSCCLSLSFYAKKEERTEHSRRSRKEEPLLQSCEPWDETLGRKANKQGKEAFSTAKKKCLPSSSGWLLSLPRTPFCVLLLWLPRLSFPIFVP